MKLSEFNNLEGQWKYKLGSQCAPPPSYSPPLKAFSYRGTFNHIVLCAYNGGHYPNCRRYPRWLPKSCLHQLNFIELDIFANGDAVCVCAVWLVLVSFRCVLLSSFSLIKTCWRRNLGSESWNLQKTRQVCS